MKVRFELVESGRVVSQWVEERPTDWGRDPLGLMRVVTGVVSVPVIVVSAGFLVVGVGAFYLSRLCQWVIHRLQVLTVSTVVYLPEGEGER